MNFLSQYPFLMLNILIWVAVLPVLIFRKDLRIHAAKLSILSIPFGFTEFLFYPDYWNPPFLFDLAERIGFGIEDFMFVTGLASMSITLPPFFLKKALIKAVVVDDTKNAVTVKSPKVAIPESSYSSMQVNSSSDVQRAENQASEPFHKTSFFSGKRALYFGLILSVAICAIAVVTVFWGVPAIYAAIILMTPIWIIPVKYRKDLIPMALWGGFIGFIVYGLQCLIFELLLPGSFETYWHTHKLLDFYVWRIPLEELLYGSVAFASALCLYPSLFNLRWKRLQ
ncbi:lycopene cyclase domain-containing protein [Chitinispirillales bacterium ANBcel5]|uniref:lycopene cyclase domain-containing protein n=1 Tax=Cellulosispirillum alkaliphilum TaxID=3039283 RepID=UPI002A51031F|nr:lycopene cyclase domain-containing protein [Chitinispirillales bacterium ANBcel5]